EIRSGISSGSGGTLIAGNTSFATQTATGRSGFDYDEYRIEVSGLNFNLTPGTYWLSVAPVGFGSGRSFVSTTSGLNALGSPAGNNQNAYINRPDTGYNFALTSDISSEWVYDFSMGVEGNVVPEPASLTLLGIGLLGFGAARRKGCVK
ncbi:MAG: PEP-CTERM sorting domain-containing protein, partial [Omnitrophica bacterium]|nr:PEP-CTERM sorting domain-containing protein [Candidatus Omnitrophota bacterium]